MNPRRNTLLRYTAPRNHTTTGVLAVLSNQVMLGGQLVAIFSASDEAALLANAPAPAPARVVFVDFHHASPDHYRRIGRLPDAATRVLGHFPPGVPAIKTKVLLEPIDALGRGSDRYCFDANWTTADIMARVDRGELSLVPVFSDSFEDYDLEATDAEALRSMQARQQRAVARRRHYLAVTPHDQPLTMLEVIPATRAAELSTIHEVPHHSINADLLWDR